MTHYVTMLLRSKSDEPFQSYEWRYRENDRDIEYAVNFVNICIISDGLPHAHIIELQNNKGHTQN
jgi:hypothetical protein